ncbi:hypothetical protein [Natrinema sp. SYSU A 869]|uniref:hypothetical protein n=1 Tax=Natrinema sp. SYSU A 869 TaxID=2871694 RepID=UPI0021051777|nr:hypothetical protein [Natrinema sp. SYSU A 869]
MTHSVFRWFRDDDGGWQFPEGRRGELVTLALGLPFLAGFVHSEMGLPRPIEYWPTMLLSTWCGFLYATYYRTAVVERVPDWVSVGQVISLLAGGFGLTVLKIVHVADLTVLFVLATGGTILAIYVVRACSPLHPGLEPPRRGVKSPPAVESGSKRGMEATASRNR